MEEEIENLVPENIVGKATDLEHSVNLPDAEQAMDTFKRAYKRLLNVPVWHELCGAASAEFYLTDASGKEVHRLAEPDDHFKIDITGPGSKIGDGFDWAKVEKITDNASPQSTEESFGLRVAAAKNPLTASGDTAHFFKNNATSTFIIKRVNNTVSAEYHGRNELPNTATDSTVDNVRNTFVAGVALAATSKMQWNALLKGLLEAEIGG
ncbi:MAG: hypothetical protein ABIR81_01990 [Ginsengibacter sp.]